MLPAKELQTVGQNYTSQYVKETAVLRREEHGLIAAAGWKKLKSNRAMLTA
jgi:hypothetical protein